MNQAGSSQRNRCVPRCGALRPCRPPLVRPSLHANPLAGPATVLARPPQALHIATAHLAPPR
ncbi:hypothetical protein XOC_3807 [Xanthomonas oryzae pv. oryzicola BLS256]|uniref:Uncharacterized protein n=1 Tax=Xanthomonas oryzae pv. oryzicola (strain BLS256) TaxID=383407 RepID=G7TGF0_XANOB|nr:hypothetical protein XOC_3807 [Xanthomonas oryzae pv. oryzicola BLS256]